MKTARLLLLERRSFWTGLEGQVVSGELAAIFNIPQATGYLVKTVAKGSPGWDMGLMGGDKIAIVAGEQDPALRQDHRADRQSSLTAADSWRTA
jgi:S1-C subfamily serine protease